MADNSGGFTDWVKSLITVPGTGAGTKTPPVGTGGDQRRKAIEDAVDQQAQGDDKIGRMRQAQSTDRDNSYSY